uniref:Uncharacterized protein n=1 Tax=Cacopsylla melanoneura TaxID=428564 RepID=A0A8D8YCE2_9HEMI
MQPGLRFCLKCGNFSSRALAVFHIKYLGHVCERSNECAIPLIYSLFAHTPCSVCTASYKTCIPNFTGPSSYLPTYNFVTTHLDTFYSFGIELARGTNQHHPLYSPSIFFRSSKQKKGRPQNKGKW